MFRIHKNFDIRSIVGKIDRDVNRGHPIEKRQQLFSLSSNMLVGTWTQGPVSAGDGDLHRNLLFLWIDNFDRRPFLLNGRNQSSVELRSQ